MPATTSWSVPDFADSLAGSARVERRQLQRMRAGRHAKGSGAWQRNVVGVAPALHATPFSRPRWSST